MNEMIQNEYLKGVGYYKHHHYHYPYIIRKMVSPLINVVNLKETWTKTTTKCVNKTQYTTAIGMCYPIFLKSINGEMSMCYQ